MEKAIIGAALAFGLSLSGVAAQTTGYEQAIYNDCAVYGCDGNFLVNVMYCESEGDPTAYNYETGDTGIMQFHPATFYAYGGTDINNPYEQIDVAARMFSEGLSYLWVCAQ